MPNEPLFKTPLAVQDSLKQTKLKIQKGGQSLGGGNADPPLSKVRKLAFGSNIWDIIKGRQTDL